MYIHVTVVTNANKESVIEERPHYFKIYVKEKAERNAANKSVLEILNNYFNYPKGGVRIINGHQNPKKLVEIGD